MVIPQLFTQWTFQPFRSKDFSYFKPRFRGNKTIPKGFNSIVKILLIRGVFGGIVISVSDYYYDSYEYNIGVTI